MQVDKPPISGSSFDSSNSDAPALASPFMKGKATLEDLDTKPILVGTKSRSFTDSSGGAPSSLPTTYSSGSPQSVLSSISTDSDTPKRFKHYQKPTAADSPTLIQTCEAALECGNISALASAARSKGLPPHLRKAAWKLLLKSHPYVTIPQLRAEFPTTSVLIAEKVPEKRIDAEVRRLRQRVERRPLMDQYATTAGSTNSSSSTGTRVVSSASSVLSAGSDDEFYEKIGDAVKTFLERYGDSVRYDPAMISVAYSLAQATGGDGLEPEMFVQAMLVFCHAPLQAMGPYGPDDSLTSDLMSKFIAALRELLPAVANHFDSEDVLRSFGGDQWMIWWLRWFGARTFWYADLARLWDIYFAWRPEAEDSIFPNNPTPQETHLFACLALMKSLRSKIMELDQSEIRQLLSNVPPSKDIESVVEEAVTLATKWSEQ